MDDQDSSLQLLNHDDYLKSSSGILTILEPFNKLTFNGKKYINLPIKSSEIESNESLGILSDLLRDDLTVDFFEERDENVDIPVFSPTSDSQFNRTSLFLKNSTPLPNFGSDRRFRTNFNLDNFKNVKLKKCGSVDKSLIEFSSLSSPTTPCTFNKVTEEKFNFCDPIQLAKNVNGLANKINTDELQSIRSASTEYMFARVDKKNEFCQNCSIGKDTLIEIASTQVHANAASNEERKGHFDPLQSVSDAIEESNFVANTADLIEICTQSLPSEDGCLEIVSKSAFLGTNQLGQILNKYGLSNSILTEKISFIPSEKDECQSSLNSPKEIINAGFLKSPDNGIKICDKINLNFKDSLSEKATDKPNSSLKTCLLESKSVMKRGLRIPAKIAYPRTVSEESVGQLPIAKSVCKSIIGKKPITADFYRRSNRLPKFMAKPGFSSLPKVQRHLKISSDSSSVEKRITPGNKKFLKKPCSSLNNKPGNSKPPEETLPSSCKLHSGKVSDNENLPKFMAKPGFSSLPKVQPHFKISSDSSSVEKRITPGNQKAKGFIKKPCVSEGIAMQLVQSQISTRNMQLKTIRENAELNSSMAPVSSERDAHARDPLAVCRQASGKLPQLRRIPKYLTPV